MTDSRDSSPDWIRDFQTPTRDIVMLSSASESPRSSDDIVKEEPVSLQWKKDTAAIDSEDDKPINMLKEKKSPKSARKLTPQQKTSSRKSGDPGHEEAAALVEKKDSILRDCEDDSQISKLHETKSTKTSKKHASKEEYMDLQNCEAMEEDAAEKPAGLPVTSRLPLVFPDKVQRSKALIECDGDSIDLSGDVGAVGRIVIADGPSGNHELLLDLKGTIYKSTIVPSRTFCIVSVGQSEAKIEAIMNDFIRMDPQSNPFEAETMVEGTLDGFSFDSDEEGDKVPNISAQQSEQNFENGEQTKKRTKGKVDKSSGVARKRAKTAAKPSKQGTRKPQSVKKSKKLKK